MCQVASLKLFNLMCIFLFSFLYSHVSFQKKTKSVCGIGCIFCYWERWKFCMPNAPYLQRTNYYVLLPSIHTAPSSSHPCAALALETFCPACMRLQAWVGACFLCPSEYEEARTKEQRFSIWFYFLCFDFLKTTFEQDLTLILQMWCY